MIENIGEQSWRIQSSNPGTSFLLLGGMHGNEATGIEVVRHFLEGFSNGTYELASGTFTCAIANTKAVAIHERWIDGRDLNRQFTSAHLVDRVDQSWEEERALYLAQLCREADVLVDIHSTNKPAEPFACGQIDPAHERIYRWFRLTNILGDPNYVLAGEAATVDEYMNLHGGVGMCIETGLAGDTTRTMEIVRSIEAIMTELGLLSRALPPLPAPPQGRYILAENIVYQPGFSFAPGMGEYSFQPIQEGDIIGFQGEEPIRSEKSGVILFPKLPIHWQVGKAVCYIAVPAL